MARLLRFAWVAFMTVSSVCALTTQGFSDTISLGRLSKIYMPLAFTHDKHMEMESNCTKCHHYTKEGDTPPCSKCHGTAAQGPKKQIAPGLKDAYHGLCIGCHKKISGPVECGECHMTKKEFGTLYLKSLSKAYQPVRFSHGYHIGLVKNCPTCHHYGEGDSTSSCGNCHENLALYRYKGTERKAGLGLKAAYHGLCVGCHEKGSGPTSCSACHGKKLAKR